MERGNDSLHRPCVEAPAASSSASASASASATAATVVTAAAQGQIFDQRTVQSDTVEVNRCVMNQAMDVSELDGIQWAVALEANPVTAVAGGVVGSSREKRKRGRPPRGQMVAAGSASVVKPPPPKRRKEEEEEDVCFICFDGGSLVLCDRKGCPKAYHPACIKRDEAFFRSKAKWNCGWHICSVCQKAAHYMCYTCTYSLCKGCTKDADYVCVRGTMGFCTTCMKTIMLIENKEQANKEMVQVDFDDQTSWEYLFKVYWVILKDKLSLTLEELTKAENPCKGVASVARKQQLPNTHHVVNHGNGFIANSSHEHLELKKPKEPEVSLSKDCRLEQTSNEISVEKASNKTSVSFVGPAEWASKELLEFVAHMKNGDASFLSQFDVQALLLEYIKINNLRDPRRKSQIICDLRLKNLFGKPRVGHIEMLKLLEFHFLIKEDSEKNAFIPAGIVGTLANHLGSGENSENSQLTSKNNRRKKCKKVEERAPAPQNNLDEYAAIDVHNVNLIYLRRSLMENLTEDEKFQDKVVGSIVRIRISANDQKQDLYRLVQVVGTSKVTIPYKIGDKTVDIMLEVLNLDKKEAVAIDTISNQEFSEDECRRLRQSIRCGLVRRLTVGEIQKKAQELLPVRLHDRLEAEILKLNHLRDRASETGRKKELRECVEKLQILKRPEELQRRLCVIPEVHNDPKMNPDYDSEENSEGFDAKKQEDENIRQKYSGFSRSGSTSTSPKRKVYPVKEDIVIRSQCTSNPKRDPTCMGDQAVVRSGLGVSTEALESGSSFSSNSSETDKLWHYRDPTGKVQGPFSMLQLRKWSMTGYFPPDMRIWINNEQNDSVLLTDALSGHFHTAADLLFSLSLPRQEVAAASDNRINNSDFRGNGKGSSQSSSTRVQFKDLDPLQDDNSCSVHLKVHHQQPQSDLKLTDSRVHKQQPQSDVKLTDAGVHQQQPQSDVRPTDTAVHCQQPEPDVRPTDVEVHHQQPKSDVRPTDSGVHHQQPQSDVRLTDIEVRYQQPQSDVKPADLEAHHQQPRPDVRPTDLEVHLQQAQPDVRPTDLEVHHQQACPDVRRPDLEVHHQQPQSDIRSTDADHHRGEVHGSEASKPDPCHEDQVSNASTFQITDEKSHENQPSSLQTTEENSHENQDHSKSHLGQSSQQNWRTFPINLNLNEMATNSGFSPATKSDSSEQNSDMDVHELRSPTPKAGDSKSEDQVAERQKPLSSNVPAETSHIRDIPLTPKPNNQNQGAQISQSKEPLLAKFVSQDSVSSWSNAPSIVARLPEIHVDWGGYSPNPAKPPVEEWSSGLVSIPSLKQPEAVGNHTAPPTSSIDPLAPTPSHPTYNLSGWHGVVEPIEFSTLAEESVSDLLAEVDAMESQSGLPSPTSAMRCGDEIMKGCKDYFSSIDDLSPTNHPGKSDALSSTVDIQLACQSSVIDEPVRASDPHYSIKRSSGPCQSSVTDEPARASDPYDHTKRSSGHSSTSSRGETKSADVPVDHNEAGSAVHPTPPRNVSRGITSTTMPPNTSVEAMDTSWGRVPGNVNLDWGSSAQGSMNTGWGPSQGMPFSVAPNLNRSPFSGGAPYDGQRRYGGERYPSTREYLPQGGDVGYGRGRPFWSRQSSGGGGGGYSRPPPKGQRICKFYENGHCKKGASCSFLHP